MEVCLRGRSVFKVQWETLIRHVKGNVLFKIELQEWPATTKVDGRAVDKRDKQPPHRTRVVKQCN